MSEPEVPAGGRGDSRGVVTELLDAWGRGGETAAGELFELLYHELRGVAARHRRRLGAADTLSTTALVHEAFLKLSPHERLTLADRRHFFATAARAMRQLLIDDARRHGAAKRGGGVAPASLDEERVGARPDGGVELLDLDRALAELARLDPRLAEVVELRFFAGLTVDETAELLEVSRRTVLREWEKARLFLHRGLSESTAGPP